MLGSIQKDVFALEISMCNLQAVYVLQSTDRLSEDAFSVAVVQESSFTHELKRTKQRCVFLL